ncbi:DUF4097 family beta strand repeat-containing protein [Mucilaginibacter ginsenosidivorans]|uniref:DUF4097 domain-containing protein n=1 Tax=Mucilaginibacter ginsenosidivorans TaxID=398053 RepID=A0A5B8UYS5_9SPHI|nr:DUF4097 domain-containing protein [Mucilaginibacter ginsenosidivorans]QEC64152.1 DUF4097 domain-containing protein [Mucilaginibacter ginsenosidivorans]
MKTFLTLFIVACQTTFALAQDDRTPYLTKSLANDAISNVVVSTSAGGIQVSGRTGEAPRIEVYIRGNNNRELSKAEIEKKLAEDYEMNIDVNGHELRAIVKTRHDFHNWNNGMSISFKIYVPQNVSTDLQTSGGGISLDYLKGNETFKTSGGGLNIDHLTGVIHGRTSGGGIRVTNSDNDIDLNTSGGGITARNCSGKIRLVTSGGGLELDDLRGDIDAHTSGGGIRGGNIRGELVTGTSGGGIELRNMDCSLEANTSGGSLSAEMKHVGKYLRLSSSAGNVEVELPAKQGLDLNLRGDRVEQIQFSGFKGDWDKEHVRGKVNGGGSPVDVSANGNVSVRFN